MPSWPRPTPPTCRDCGGTQLEVLGPSGNWDGYYAGGIIFKARCLACGAVWTRYAWGLGAGESPDDVHWGKEGSATDPPRLPVGAEVNPALQVAEGQLVQGVVVNVAPFGLFVSLAPRLDGLLLFDHTPYPEIARRFRVGDTLDVLVRTVDPERVKVHLELLPDPTRYEGFWSQVPRKHAEPGAAADGGRDSGSS